MYVYKADRCLRSEVKKKCKMQIGMLTQKLLTDMHICILDRRMCTLDRQICILGRLTKLNYFEVSEAKNMQEHVLKKNRITLPINAKFCSHFNKA